MLTCDLAHQLVAEPQLSAAPRTAAAAAAPPLAPREPRSALLGPAGCAELVVAGEDPAERASRQAARARAAQLHAFWISHLGLVSTWRWLCLYRGAIGASYLCCVCVLSTACWA